VDASTFLIALISSFLTARAGLVSAAICVKANEEMRERKVCKNLSTCSPLPKDNPVQGNIEVTASIICIERHSLFAHIPIAVLSDSCSE